MGTIQRPHPAVYSDSIIKALKEYLPDYLPDGATILDPFAGSGKIDFLRPQYETWGIEIEPEWAIGSEHVVVGDAMYPEKAYQGKFQAMVTSPCYGNRMADNFTARDASKRITYRTFLDRPPTDGSSAKMQWGETYREFHKRVWAKMLDMVVEPGLFVINISNHIRNHKVVDVAGWHRDVFLSMGLELKESLPIVTPRMGFGENGASRVEEEWIYFFQG